MKEVTVRNATAEDCYDIGTRLAPLDDLEVMLSSPYEASAPEIVKRSWDVSNMCKVAECDGEVKAIWGTVRTDKTGVYCIWLLVSYDIGKYWREFITTMIQELAHILANTCYVYNDIWTMQRMHIKLLSKLGAAFTDYSNTGVYTFKRFIIKGKKPCVE